MSFVDSVFPRNEYFENCIITVCESYRLHFLLKLQYIVLVSTNTISDKLDLPPKIYAVPVDFDFEHICIDHFAMRQIKMNACHRVRFLVQTCFS